jgi:hypothetical protein
MCTRDLIWKRMQWRGDCTHCASEEKMTWYHVTRYQHIHDTTNIIGEGEEDEWQRVSHPRRYSAFYKRCAWCGSVVGNVTGESGVLRTGGVPDPVLCTLIRNKESRGNFVRGWENRLRTSARPYLETARVDEALDVLIQEGYDTNCILAPCSSWTCSVECKMPVCSGSEDIYLHY